jgi:anti-anti-sigma factor
MLAALSALSNSRAAVRLIDGGEIGVMLIITTESHSAIAARKGLLARACRQSHTPNGRTTTKAVDEIIASSGPDSRSAVLRVEGTLRTPVDGLLRSRVESLLHCGVRRVLLDLSGVSSIDAAGVGELIHLFITSAAAGGVLEIGGMRPRVRRILEATGVLRLLDVEYPGTRSTCR